ncbi:MAG TPA: hypothetical protein VLB44_10895 [Kofleriaceae bacterium]|nr:hypothetical protein [Kofleriaceae bacterium]
MLLRHLALASTLALGAPAMAYAAPEAPAAVETVKVKTPAPAADSRSYAEREKQDKKAADFQGGDLIVVGISGGALIVLLFLLLILA